MSRICAVLAASAGLFVLLSAPAAAENLALVCEGVGTYPAQEHGSVYAQGSGGPVYGGGTVTRTESVTARVRVIVDGESARILMPPAMTPPINTGSDGGWWRFDRLSVTDDAITGRFVLNPFNKPRVQIDRHTGSIEVDGNFRYYFLGECERDDSASQAPRF